MQRQTAAARESSSYTSMSSSVEEAQRLDCRRKFFHSPFFPEERHTLEGRSACSSCRRMRSRHTIIQSHMVIEYNCRARCSVHCDTMQFRKVTSNLPHKKVAVSTTARSQLVQGKRPLCLVTVAAMSPREHPSTQIELPPQGERGVASPTLGPPNAIELRPLHSVHPQ